MLMAVRSRVALLAALLALIAAGCQGGGGASPAGSESAGATPAEVPAWVVEAKGSLEQEGDLVNLEGEITSFEHEGETVWLLEEGNDADGLIFAEDCGGVAATRAAEEFGYSFCFERGGGFVLVPQ